MSLTPDQASVFRAVPGSRAIAKTLTQIADGIDMEPMMISGRLRTLQLMGLVDCAGDGWSRTHEGDELAMGRAR